MKFVAVSVVVVLTVFFIQQCHSTLVVETGPLANTSMPTAQLFKKGDDLDIWFNTIRGELVLENATSVTGKIVYLHLIPISYMTTVKKLQESGAIGVLTAEPGLVPGRLYCTQNGEDFISQISIPIAQGNTADIQPLLDSIVQGDVIEVTLSSEGNEWADVISSPAFVAVYRIVLLLVGSAVSVFAIVKLALYIRIQGPEFNVPQICLGIEVIGNLLRVIALGDPFGCSFIYPFPPVSILQQMNGVFTQPTFYLLTMYWYEAMTVASIKIYPFLSKMQIPFYVFTCLLLLLAVMFPLLNLYLGLRIITVLAGLYSGLSMAFLIFYIVTVVKVMKRLARSVVDKERRRTKLLVQINRDMIMSGVAKFASVVIGLLFIVESVATRPAPYIIVWAVLFLALYFDSFCRIWTFNLKSAKARASSGSSAKSPSGTTKTQTTTGVEVNVEM